MHRAILSLGTNCEPRFDHLERAVSLLAGDPLVRLEGIERSSIYESAALLPPDAPIEWDMPYYNMVITGMTTIDAHRLLQRTKGIEAKVGRVDRGWWAPREIDIDILALGEACIDSPHLCVPHSQMLKRDFVMVPLAELFPDWRHPRDESGRTAQEYADSYAHRGGARRVCLGSQEAA